MNFIGHAELRNYEFTLLHLFIRMFSASAIR